MSKGTAQRPLDVSAETFRKNWDRTFNTPTSGYVIKDGVAKSITTYGNEAHPPKHDMALQQRITDSVDI